MKTLSKKDVLDVIRSEITWHQKNYKKNILSKEKKDHFIKGLRYASYLIKEMRIDEGIDPLRGMKYKKKK